MAMIKCSECGKNISEKAKMCPKCGCPINEKEDNIKFLSEKCPNCGAVLNYNPNESEIIYQYCKYKILINDKVTELDRIEKVKLNSRINEHNQTLKKFRTIMI